MSEVLVLAFVDERCNALSPMAATLADDLGGEAVRASGAGLQPEGRILPGALTVLREVGLDTGKLVPSPASRAELEAADVVVALGAIQEEAVVSELAARHWELASPEGGQLAAFRETRDELALRVRELLREHDVELQEAGPGFE